MQTSVTYEQPDGQCSDMPGDAGRRLGIATKLSLGHVLDAQVHGLALPLDAHGRLWHHTSAWLMKDFKGCLEGFQHSSLSWKTQGWTKNWRRWIQRKCTTTSGASLSQIDSRTKYEWRLAVSGGLHKYNATMLHG
eukprot:3083997-Amphidinium_carterae.1